MKEKLWILCLLIAACGPKAHQGPYPTIPYRAHDIPKGSGWSCYTYMIGSSRPSSECYRSSSECAEDRADTAKKPEKKASECTHVDTAFCYTGEHGDDHQHWPAGCAIEREHCEFARQAHQNYGGAVSPSCQQEN